MNGSYEGICVEFESKNNTTLGCPLSNYPQVLKHFYDQPFNILLVDFCI